MHTTVTCQGHHVTVLTSREGSVTLLHFYGVSWIVVEVRLYLYAIEKLTRKTDVKRAIIFKLLKMDP
jgi:hypothetical protein